MSRVTARVTARSHPAIFKALREIDYDHGAVNRGEPERTYDDVPEPWIQVLDEAECGLATLTPKELETFCTGESIEIEAIGERSPALLSAGYLLNAYFNGWPESARAAEKQERRGV